MVAPLLPDREPTEGSRRSVLLPALGIACVVLLLVVGVRAGWDRLQKDPSRDGETKVLFVGDSLMIESAWQLATRFGQDGVQARFVGYPGTGLLSGQGWWNREITHAVDTWKPDVVVIEACCNYRMAEPGYFLDDGTVIDGGSPQMYEQWATQANDAVERAGAHGADVYWVVTPAADEELWPGFGERIDRFNEIYAGTDATPIDWRGVVTPDGEFRSTMEIDGTDVKIRKDDGLHFTSEGIDVLVDVTHSAVAEDLGLT
jgi:hypothetical protein